MPSLHILGVACMLSMVAACGGADDGDKNKDSTSTKTLSLTVNSGFQTKFGYQALRQLGAQVRASDADLNGAAQDITVTFTATPKDTGGKVTFYADENLQIESSTAKIRQGLAGADIYFTADALSGDSVSIVASSDGYANSDPLVVPITQSIIRLKNPSTAPTKVTVDTCSEINVTMVTRDTLEWVFADVDVVVTPTLTATPSAATAGLYQDDQCLTKVTSTKIIHGSDDVPLYVKDSSVGNTLTIGVTASGFPAVDALTLTTVAAAP